MKHKKLIVLIILFALALIYVILSSNYKLKTYKEKINNEYSNLLIEIENKYNIIESINEISKINTEEIKNINEVISKMKKAYNINKKIDLNNELDNKVNILIIKNADNPNIQNSSNYQHKLKELDNTNKKIISGISKYNNRVKLYNKKLKIFPYSIVSKIFNMKKESIIK